MNPPIVVLRYTSPAWQLNRKATPELEAHYALGYRLAAHSQSVYMVSVLGGGPIPHVCETYILELRKADQ